MRVLIVENDKKAASFLKKGFQEQGYVSDLAATAEDGLHAACSCVTDLVVVNMALPDRDGWSFVSELRRQGNNLPIVCLSERDSVQDRVRGLELGADDFLRKPFAFSELLARIKAILRRTQPRKADMVRIGDLEVDFRHHRVRRDTRCIDLTAKEFQLLALLCCRAGEVLSRTVITEQIWDMNFESDSNVVDVLVRRLRRKVETLNAKQLIHTIRGIGYVLDDQR